LGAENEGRIIIMRRIMTLYFSLKHDGLTLAREGYREGYPHD